ncbi:MAG: thioredoxin family protein [Acidobacteriota bacterium]|nr:thioredoxin family protein [Acidobacteriota bacterium]
MKLELLYFDGCPGYAELRARLPGLLARSGVDARIVERRVESDDDAERERFPGSPTVRIDGQDIEPSSAAAGTVGLTCRLYATPDGLARTPPDDLIIGALKRAAA